MVTLREIAKAVGVSPGTASRVLNFDQTLSVAPKTRQAIIEAAEAMKYENPRARIRANQQGLSKVALVHSLRPEQELVDPYYVGLRLGIESRCQADRECGSRFARLPLEPARAQSRRTPEQEIGAAALGVYGLDEPQQ